MRCASARRLEVDRQLGRLGPRVGAKLEAHLEECPACRRASRDEARLSALLGDLALSAPPPVDVRARVMLEIARAPGRRAVSRRPHAVAAAFAICGLVSLVATLPSLRPVLPGLLALARGALDVVAAVVSAVTSAIGAALVPIARALGARAEAWESLGRALATAAPATAFLIAAGHAAMALTVIAVLYRDLARTSRPRNGGRP